MKGKTLAARPQNLGQGFSTSLLRPRLPGGLGPDAPRQAVAQLLSGTRLRAHAFQHEALAQRLYRALGTYNRQFFVPNPPGKGAYELSLYFAHFYADFWARAHVQQTLDRPHLEQVITQELKRVARGYEPFTKLGWRLQAFSLDGRMRQTTRNEAKWLLDHGGARQLTDLFAQVSSEATDGHALGAFAAAPRLTRERALEATRQFERVLLAGPTQLLKAKPLTPHDVQVLTEFAMGSRGHAHLTGTRSWFEATALPANGQPDGLGTLATAVRTLVETIEPTVKPKIVEQRTALLFESLRTPFFHVDSAVPRDLEILFRGLVAVRGVGPLGMADGRITAVQEHEVLLFWGEPARRLGLEGRTALTHSSPARQHARGRALGEITIVSRP